MHLGLVLVQKTELQLRIELRLELKKELERWMEKHGWLCHWQQVRVLHEAEKRVLRTPPPGLSAWRDTPDEAIEGATEQLGYRHHPQQLQLQLAPTENDEHQRWSEEHQCWILLCPLKAAQGALPLDLV